MECCGQDRLTNFCPDCGKEIRCDPLGEILVHLRGQLKGIKAREENARRKMANGDDGWWAKQNSKLGKSITRYERWIAALVEASRK